MAHPTDNSAFLSAADDIRAYEYQRGQAEQQEKVNELSILLSAERAKVSNLTALVDLRTVERDAARDEYAGHMATQHVAEGPTARDLIGCRIFPQYADKVYGQHDALFSWIEDSGLQRITGQVGPETPEAAIKFYQRLRDELGIKFWFTIGKPRQVFTAAQQAKVVALADRLGDSIEQVANWNEPNHLRNSGDIPLAGWETKVRPQQQWLWDTFHPRGIDVATPQLWSGDFRQHEADLRKMAPALEGLYDVIAWHLYPRGGVGADLVQEFYDLYFSVLGVHPVCCTEGGYFDAPKYTGGAVAVTQAQAAEYLPQHARLYTDRGDRFGGFELLNDPDPSQANRESNLGWINTPTLDPATWTAKPVFTAMKALVTA